MKPVLVIWKDIVSDDGWHTADQLDDFAESDNTVRQLGYLYEEDENQVILMDSYFEKKDLYGGVHKIPRGCIVSIEYL
jgi:hypothetical protein